MFDLPMNVTATGALIGLLVTIGVSLWRGWVTPRPITNQLLATKQEVADLYKLTAETERARADGQQADLVRLMRELTAALERSRPAAGV